MTQQYLCAACSSTCAQASQGFETLARAIQAANESIQCLSTIHLPPYTSIAPDVVVPAIETLATVSPSAPSKASTPAPQSPPNSPANLPATPIEIPDSRSPSPNTSSDVDSDNSSVIWARFGANPIALMSESDLPASLHAMPASNPVNPPGTTLVHIDSVPPEDRWYAVIVGRQPGVFCGVHNAVPNVNGIPGACFRRYPTKKLAEEAYSDALDSGRVCQVEVIVTRRVVSRLITRTST
ncbi:hypothetical protein BD779DRAFT_1555736, partial [Infundibulicybe gibba]